MTVKTVYRVEVTAPDPYGKYWSTEYGDRVRNIIFGSEVPLNSGSHCKDGVITEWAEYHYEHMAKTVDSQLTRYLETLDIE